MEVLKSIEREKGECLQERKLIATILREAYRDATEGPRGIAGDAKRRESLKADAREWILSMHADFRGYCRLLGIEPSKIRDRLLQELELVDPYIVVPRIDEPGYSKRSKYLERKVNQHDRQRQAKYEYAEAIQRKEERVAKEKVANRSKGHGLPKFVRRYVNCFLQLMEEERVWESKTQLYKEMASRLGIKPKSAGNWLKKGIRELDDPEVTAQWDRFVDSLPMKKKKLAGKTQAAGPMSELITPKKEYQELEQFVSKTQVARDRDGVEYWIRFLGIWRIGEPYSRQSRPIKKMIPFSIRWMFSVETYQR